MVCGPFWLAAGLCLPDFLLHGFLRAVGFFPFFLFAEPGKKLRCIGYTTLSDSIFCHYPQKPRGLSTASCCFITRSSFCCREGGGEKTGNGFSVRKTGRIFPLVERPEK